MKLLVTALLVVLATACTRAPNQTQSSQQPTQPDPGGSSGTRGGGDACEIDYRANLKRAAVWLKQGGQAVLSASEKAKVARLKIESLDDVQVACPLGDLIVDGKAKTVLTTVDSKGVVKMQIDPDRWFGPLSGVRLSLATHEILVMLSIEHTDDYHVSSYLRQDSHLPIVKSYQCRKRVSAGHELNLFLTESSNPILSGFGYKGSLGFETVDASEKAVSSKTVDFSDRLECSFSMTDDQTFTCYEVRLPGDLRKTAVALQMIRTADGLQLQINWDQLDTPSLPQAAVRELVKAAFPFTLTSQLDMAESLPFGSPLDEYPLDEPEATRCTIVEAD